MKEYISKTKIANKVRRTDTINSKYFANMIEEESGIELLSKEEMDEIAGMLKSCPFCNDKAYLIKHESLSSNFIGYYVYHSSFKCVCPEIRTRITNSAIEAIEDWNYRDTEIMS